MRQAHDNLRSRLAQLLARIPRGINTQGWRTSLRYLGLSRVRRDRAIRTPEQLAEFLESRASHIAQTSLYGYLRTRAGSRYPELFDDDAFARSINHAKWQIWLACLSDLCVFAGGLVSAAHPQHRTMVTGMLRDIIKGVLDRTGIPPDAGPEFTLYANQTLARVDSTDWQTISDDESAFVLSPDALVRWAPVVDQLKELDAEIVRNSIRFRWQEIRRALRRSLDARSLVEHCESPAPDHTN